MNVLTNPNQKFYMYQGVIDFTDESHWGNEDSLLNCIAKKVMEEMPEPEDEVIVRSEILKYIYSFSKQDIENCTDEYEIKLFKKFGWIK
jgi:hypothetical protein